MQFLFKSRHQNLLNTFCGATLLLCTPGLLQAQTPTPANLLENPSFVDADGDKTPDKWKSSAPAEGESLRVTNEGDAVRILDQDKNNGAGLAQIVPVEAGHNYKFTAQVKSAGGLGVYIQFLDRVPAREADISKHRISEKRQMAPAGPDFQEVSVTAVAPANTKQARVWFYCPKIGLTDALVKNASLTDLGLVPGAPTTSTAPPATAPGKNSSAPAGTTEAAVLANPDFADADADGLPDGWRVFPDADGTATKVAMAPGGGVQITDTDKGKGIGIQQQLPAQAGTAYTLSATLKGTSGISLNFQFLSDRPARDSDLKKLMISNKSVFGNGTPEGKETTLTATAPAGTKWMRVWLYCPNIGVTDVAITKTSLTSVAGSVPVVAPAASNGGAAPGAPRSAASAATGTWDTTVLANPEFKDADGDGSPDGWRLFPDADGTGTKVAMAPGGGVQITDTDKSKGVGIQQQLPAQAGVAYTFSATLKGTSGLSLNFQFLSEKPARDSDLKNVMISNKSVFGNGTPEGKETTLTATAPAGTKWMRVWIYCPNIGVTDVAITKASLTSAAAAPVAAVTNDKLLFVGDFEGGNFDGWNTQFPHSTKGEIVTSPVRAGKYALKNIFTYSDFKTYGDSRNRRSEVYTLDVGKPGQERWYGFSLYLPKDWEDNMFDIVMQIHNHPDPGEGPKSPILSLVTEGKNWNISDRWDKERISVPAKNGSGGTITTKQVWKAPYETEKWTDFVLHVKWSLEDDGLIEVWKDGEKVAESKGPNCYNDEKPFYMKIGVYKPAYRVTSPPQRIIYHDEVRIGNEKATYADVAPPAR